MKFIKKIIGLCILFVMLMFSVNAISTPYNVLGVNELDNYYNTSNVTVYNISNILVNSTTNTETYSPSKIGSARVGTWNTQGTALTDGYLNRFVWKAYYSAISRTVTATIRVNGEIVGYKEVVTSSSSPSISLTEADYTDYIKAGDSWTASITDIVKIEGDAPNVAHSGSLFTVSGQQYGQSIRFIELNVTETNTNLSYILNNDPVVEICSNCNNINFTLTSLIDDIYNLSVISTSVYNLDYNNQTFTIDTTYPTINIFNTSERNNYFINWSNVFNYSDLNLDSCNIYVEGDYQNCSSYTFIENGNQTINISVNDTVGHITTTSFNIMINPYVYLYFNDSNNNRLSNFTLNGTFYNNYVNFTVYDYGLGTHKLLFEKLGFDTVNITLTLNETSNINKTYVVPFASIIFNFYNIIDNSYIENQNTTTIQIIGEGYSQTFNTTNRNYTVIDDTIISDTYDVIVSNLNYEAVNTLFTYTNQKELILNIYMTPTTVIGEEIADLIVEIQDEDGSIQGGILSYAYIWDSESLEYVLINQKVTDYSGQTSYKVILDTRSYQFCAEYNDILFCNDPITININTDKVIVPIDKDILMESEATSIYSINFPYTLNNVTTGNNSIISFTWVNSYQNIDNYCLNVYKLVDGVETLLSPNGEQCSISHSSGLSLNVTLENEVVYRAKAIIELDGVDRILDVIDFNTEYELLSFLEKYGLHKLVALILLFVGLAIGLSKKFHNITFSHIGVSVSYLVISLIFPILFSLDIFIIVALVNWNTVRLITKRDDTGTKTNTRMVLSVVILYVLMIFTTVSILTDFEDKNMLDDYGENLLSYLTDGDDSINTELEIFINQSSTQLSITKDGTSVAGEDKTDNTLTFFIKSLGWVDSFFNIMSKVFSIPETIYIMLGFTTVYLTSLFIYLNWILNIAIMYIFYDSLFK